MYAKKVVKLNDFKHKRISKSVLPFFISFVYCNFMTNIDDLI